MRKGAETALARALQGGKGQGSSRGSGDASSATAAAVASSLIDAPPVRSDASTAAVASGRQLRLAEGDAGRGKQQQQQQRGKRREPTQAGTQSVELFSHLQQYRVRSGAPAS